jgi:membrane-bound serine protease (ClpP class)
VDGRAVVAGVAGLMGVEGEVLAPLRPAGVASLGGRRVDVVSRGEMIESGARVRVIELEGNRVVVARAPAAAATGGAQA